MDSTNVNVCVNTKELKRINQGDILRNVEYIERAEQNEIAFEIHKIIFPYVVVLSQDCDLEQEYSKREKISSLSEGLEYYQSEDIIKNDKFLLSVIVAPVYNEEHFFQGSHLEYLKVGMNDEINKKKTEGKKIFQNNDPRYHSFKFDDSVELPDSIIDFKHFFTVNLNLLEIHKQNNYVCTLDDLFRERLSQRFCNFLSRIGLPTIL